MIRRFKSDLLIGLACAFLLAPHGRARGGEPAAHDFVQGVRQRVLENRGYAFTYKVTAEIGPGPVGDTPGGPLRRGTGPSTFIKATETLKILPPLGASLIPRRSWYRQENGKISQFGSYDGSVTHKWVQSKSKRKRSSGAILPVEDPDLWNRSTFCRVISSDLTYTTEFEDHAWKQTDECGWKWEVVGAEPFMGYPAHQLKGVYPRFKAEVLATVLDAPHFLIVKSELWSNREERQLGCKVDITRLGKVGDFVYPAAGVYVQEPISVQKKIDYKFNVTKVTRIDESAAKDWHMPWPPGTNVRDTKTDINFSTPFSPEQEKERALGF